MATLDKQITEFLAAILQCTPSLEGADMQYWVENRPRLSQVLEQALVLSEKVWKRKAWKTIILNFLVSIEGFAVDKTASDMLERVDSDRTSEVNLALITASEVGVRDEFPSYKQVCDAAVSRGLARCHPSVALHFRKQYLDQPCCTTIVVGMEPVVVGDSCPCVFELWSSSSDRKMLQGVREDRCRHKDIQYVFKIPKL